MRKQVAAARRLEFQLFSQQVGIDGNEKEPGLARKMPPGRLCELFAGRKVDKAVRKIDGRAFENAFFARLAPE